MYLREPIYDLAFESLAPSMINLQLERNTVTKWLLERTYGNVSSANIIKGTHYFFQPAHVRIKLKYNQTMIKKCDLTRYRKQLEIEGNKCADGLIEQFRDLTSTITALIGHSRDEGGAQLSKKLILSFFRLVDWPLFNDGSFYYPVLFAFENGDIFASQRSPRPTFATESDTFHRKLTEIYSCPDFLCALERIGYAKAKAWAMKRPPHRRVYRCHVISDN